ncbi:hypothetical protein E2C01_078345 [Portunus trituberculatus]|uniref:Uncharacterized protein n=1 Tax=Portunus trituberculatus TaxID=210409 RepID=A0A5B7IE28_PORTR|nr:hypothetical protein [Portunus trituberculatus]
MYYKFWLWISFLASSRAAACRRQVWQGGSEGPAPSPQGDFQLSLSSS